MQPAKSSPFPAWFRYGIIVVLVLGIFFRFYNLDKKVYWIDEVNSSLRSLGYSKTEVVDEMFTGKVVTAGDLQQYQRLSPDKTWRDTFNSLTGTAEHAPLYFLLSRLWVGWVGHSIATMRCLAAIFSVLAFPCLYWLCRELFEAPGVAWIAIALVSVSPLHMPYAQEARPYSLWTVMTLLSSAVLLWAMRTKTRVSWVTYGMTIALGLYTQLLFGAVALVHGIYVLIREQWRFSKTTLSYGLAAGIGFLSFVPWIINFIHNLEKVKESTSSLTGGYSLNYMIDRWFLSINQVLLDRELGGLNIILVLLTIYAFYYLCRHAPKRSGLFILTLVAVSFLVLALPDLIWGGRRSLRIRYLFPFFLGIQIALAYLFATQAIWAKTWKQKIWRLVMIVLIVSGMISASVSSQATVWWNKSVPRSSYYPLLGEWINRTAQVETPIVISDGSPTDTLAFSYWLNPEVKMMLALEPRKLKLRQMEQFKPIFLLNPEEPTKNFLNRRGYDLTLLYEDTVDPEDIEQRLWLVKQRDPSAQ
ncbi:MAG: hypothetical protein HC769_04030 [Cyanobacteria bacterium CRU_2_1]|nr:hypothetical protein [Cyanobacteria bacterium RU_5_0]NJR58087.1 hypothetical protein [Cyanobacteria bacterium CRU_2_1]